MNRFLFLLLVNTYGLLSVSSCIHRPPAAARPVAVKKTFDPSLASPINTRLIEEHPHLRAFKDQLFLGNDLVQLIITGIPGSPSSNYLHPLILGAFTYKDNKWTEYSENFPIWISFDSPQKRTWFPIGFSLTNNEKYSSITYTWSNLNDKEKLQTEIALKKNKALSSFMVENEANKNINWHLYFNKNLGFNTSLPFDQAKMISFQNSDEFLTVASSSTLLINKLSNTIGLRSENQKNKFHLLFGESILLESAALVSNMESCTEMKTISQIFNCIDNTEVNNTTTKINIFNTNDKLSDFLYPYWIKNTINQETFYLPIRSISENNITYNSTSMYKLYNMYSSVNDSYEISKLTDDVEVKLPPLKETTLKFSSDSKVFVTLESKYPKGQFSFNESNIPKGSTLIADNIIKVNKWPLKLTIPEGSYYLKFFDDNSILCVEELSAKSSDEIICEKRISTYKLKEYFWPVKKDIFLDLENQYKLINLENNFSFVVEDKNTPFAIQVNTNDRQAKRKWDKYYQQKKLPILPLIKKFNSEFLKDSTLTLKCPSKNFEIEDYLWLMSTIKPQFAEIFNCTNNYQESKIVSYIHKMRKRYPTKIIPAEQSPLARFSSHIKTNYKNKDDSNYVNFGDQTYSLYTTAYLGLKDRVRIVDNKLQIKTETINLTNQVNTYKLIIYSKTGVQIQKSFATKSGITTEQSFDINISEQTKWLRVELYQEGKLIAIIPPFQAY